LDELMPTQTNPPQNRDTTGRFLAGHSGNPGGHPVGFREQIKESTDDGSELVEVVMSCVTRTPVTENVWKLLLG
jgi:hypothetical protein